MTTRLPGVRHPANTSNPATPDARRATTPSFVIATVVLAVGFVLSVIVSVAVGAVSIPLWHVAEALWTPPHAWDTAQGILMQVRLPRVLTSALVGAGLALAGLALQAVLRNPLAEPYLLGISSGASLGAVSVIVLGASVALPLAAFGGGLLALALTLALSVAGGRLGAQRMILAGVAVTALLSAITSFVIFQAPDGDGYRQVMYWLMGSLASSSWQSVLIAGLSFAVFGGAILAVPRLFDAFRLDDAEMFSIGIDARRSRMILLALAALLAAGMVSVSGAIGFVGLIVPHLTRPLARGSQRRHATATVLAGAILLMWADTVARIVVLPRELPVGIMTSVLGAVVFAMIMLRQRGKPTP